jgi:hypothetical protein
VALPRDRIGGKLPEGGAWGPANMEASVAFFLGMPGAVETMQAGEEILGSRRRGETGK